MATSNTQGIQQLLAAEKKAADKVGDARKRKSISIISMKKIQWLKCLDIFTENIIDSDHVSCMLLV